MYTYHRQVLFHFIRNKIEFIKITRNKSRKILLQSQCLNCWFGICENFSSFLVVIIDLFYTKEASLVSEYFVRTGLQFQLTHRPTSHAVFIFLPMFT